MVSFDIKDFEKPGNLMLIPPYIKHKDLVVKAWKEAGFEDHVFIFSSGTISQAALKTYALSKNALVNNAKAVNSFLGCHGPSTWLASLPPFHVGGLSIYVRSLLNSKMPIELTRKWTAEVMTQDVNYASMVPAQLYEVLKQNISPSKILKGVFIGGDFLSDELRMRAIEQGWPLIGTYGMTEVCSQLASSYLTKEFDGFLDILPIHKLNQDGSLESESFYSAQINISPEQSEIISATNPFFLPDNYLLEGKRIKPLGRKDDQIKIKGRLVNVVELRSILESIALQFDAYGQVVILKTEANSFKVVAEQELAERVNLILDDFYSLIPEFLNTPFELNLVDKIPKTVLGKVKR